MSQRTHIRPKRRTVCIGEMDTRVRIFDRTLKPPTLDAVDLVLDFDFANEVWAMVNTAGGKSFFDGVADRTYSHDLYIQWREDVDATKWVEFASDGIRLDILTTEDLDRQQEFLHLRCDERGAATIPATQA